MHMSVRFRFVFPLLNGSASGCFSSYLLVLDLTFHFVKISHGDMFHELDGSFPVLPYLYFGLGLWFCPWGWGFGRGLGFLFGAFAVLGFLWVRFMIWVLMIYENC